MKKILFILFVSLGAAFVACGDDNTPGNGNEWFLSLTTQVDVSNGTTVDVSARTAMAPGVLTAGPCGFAYARVDNGTISDLAETFDVVVSGQTISARLENLDPETYYITYAFVGSGTGRVVSRQSLFQTGQGGDPALEPVFETPGSTDVTDTSATIGASFAYEGDEPITAVYFLYQTESGTPVKVDVSTTVGAKEAQLTGLAAETTYTFKLCVEIGSEVYASASRSFTTIAAETVVPDFGTPSHANITASSATVSASFSYAGDENISRVYFTYTPTAGGAKEANVSDLTPGAKSAQLSGLDAATTYTYQLFVVIGANTYNSTSSSFTTLPGGGGTTTTLNADWPELPTTKEKTGDWYYTYHITDVNTPKGQKARNYSVCYSKELMCAVWVAAPMHTFYSQKNADRTNSYKTDPKIPFTQPGHWDGYTRGHMLGSAERLVSRTSNQQVFYYSNIAPQIGAPYFNTGGGAWNNLEDWVDTQWTNNADTTYQVIGSYWANKNKVESGTTIPTHYYKVLLRTKNHVNKWVKDCAGSELQCVAVMVEHKGYSQNMNNYNPSEYAQVMSVAALEQMTGLTFFGNVPNAPKDTYSMSDWPGL